jgi:hypothetical protein
MVRNLSQFIKVIEKRLANMTYECMRVWCKFELRYFLETPPQVVNLISAWLSARLERSTLQSARHHSQSLAASEPIASYMSYSKVFRLIFQVFYRKWPNDIPHRNTAIILSLMIVMNSGWVLAIMLSVLGLGFPTSSSTWGLILYLGIFATNYFLFIGNNQYQQYQKDYNNLELPDKKNQLYIGTAVLLIGYLLPIAMIIFLLKV